MFRFSAAIYSQPNASQKKDVNSIKPIKKGIVVAAFSTNTLFDRLNQPEKNFQFCFAIHFAKFENASMLLK
jgi:hypothetical protein